MVKAVARIRNEKGIHCRPSALIIKEMAGYQGRIIISANGESCDVKSVVGLLSLCLLPGSEVEIEVVGDDEEVTCAKMVELFEREFDFPDISEEERQRYTIQ